MHSSFVFPMKCQSDLVPIKNPAIKEVSGELFIIDEGDNTNHTYDGFDFPELLPEFVALVRKLESSRKKENLIKAWVKKWGFLREVEISEGVYGQSVESFLRDVGYFKATWLIYKISANRDMELLKFGYGKLEEMGILTQYSDDPLTNYQWNSINTLKYAIEANTKNGRLVSSDLKMLQGKNTDKFQITPAIEFSQLLEVLYMQFYMALTENKRICPICHTPFTPNRADQVYCQPKGPCYNTAKSRRYRKSKKSII